MDRVITPCHSVLTHTFSQTAEVTIGHVDCTADGNANRELCSAHGVNGFPTLNSYKNGEEVKMVVNIMCRPYTSKLSGVQNSFR